MIYVDFGDFEPKQQPITRERIQQMITRRPRRMKLSFEWPDTLHEPSSSDKDWSLSLPFCETLGNAFGSMCRVPHIGIREGKDHRGYTYLKDANENTESLREVRRWITTVGEYVAIRDCLALSFALDYDREGGNPKKARTRIGDLRSRAKPYDRSPRRQTYVAADKLAEACVEFLEKVECYESASCVLAMPPSAPERSFDLPSYLCDKIAKSLRKPDFSSAVRTVRTRPPLKGQRLEGKLSSIEGTVSVRPDVLKDQVVLLVDDLYQSGVSMNYVAMLVLEAGAKKVFGLACEKTCSNDDNVTRGSR